MSKEPVPEGFVELPSVDGDGNCFFYAVYASAAAQNIDLSVLQYTDPTTGGFLRFRGTNALKFSAFMRGFLSTSEAYARDLKANYIYLKSIDKATSQKILESMTDIYRNQYLSARYPDNFVRRVQSAILENKDADNIMWVTELEANIVKQFLKQFGIHLAMSNEDMFLFSHTPNTIFVRTVKEAHYWAYAPVSTNRRPRRNFDQDQIEADEILARKIATAPPTPPHTVSPPRKKSKTQTRSYHTPPLATPPRRPATPPRRPATPPRRPATPPRRPATPPRRPATPPRRPATPPRRPATPPRRPATPPRRPSPWTRRVSKWVEKKWKGDDNGTPLTRRVSRWVAQKWQGEDNKDKPASPWTRRVYRWFVPDKPTSPWTKRVYRRFFPARPKRESSTKP
jgi:hypothetical protein